MAIDEGMYELRTILQTSMVVTGSGYTPVTGSNVFLYSWNDGNNRKWRFTKESDGKWLVRNASNGLYMASKSSEPTNGTNVIQWTYNTRGQLRWNVIETGETVNYEGYTCPVVRLGNYATSDGATWMLDVDGAMTKNSTNMEVNRSNSNDSQRFALVPSELMSNDYPVPANLGWTYDTDNDPYITHADAGQTQMKIGWRFPTTWVPDESKGYERRVRTRLMSKSTSTWGSWSQWTQWADVDPYLRGLCCYDANAVDGSFNTSSYKAKEVQAEVRCTAEDRHGHTAASTMRCIVDPVATIAMQGATKDGIVLSVSSDYVPANYTIRSMEVDGSEILTEPVSAQVVSGAVSLTVPWGKLRLIPDDGATVTVRYSRGTDLFASINGGGTRDTTVTVSYGTAPSVAPRVAAGGGRTLSVSHSAGVTSVWTSNGESVVGGTSASRVLYPFGDSLRVLVTLRDGTVYVADMAAIVGNPAHAFNWAGGSFLLELREGEPLATDVSVDREYEAFKLNKREWESVHYQRTKSGSIDATGAIVGGISESDRRDLDALVEQGYVTYRSPFGLVAQVAVTGYTLTERKRWDEVSVSMKRVTN